MDTLNPPAKQETAVIEARRPLYKPYRAMYFVEVRLPADAIVFAVRLDPADPELGPSDATEKPIGTLVVRAIANPHVEPADHVVALLAEGAVADNGSLLERYEGMAWKAPR